MRICIIKLGALGDVVRTLPIIEALKEKAPESEIVWITKENALEIFEGNPDVTKVLTIPIENLSELDSFDTLYNFDIEREATELANKITADKKYGFGSEGDYAVPFNASSEYYLSTMFDDGLKKENRRTYQDIMFDSAELEWKKQKPNIFLNDSDKQFAEKFLDENNLRGKNILGIHVGAGSRWPSKVWHEDNLKEFVKLAKGNGYDVLLFGGPNEKEQHEKIILDLEKDGIKIYRNNPENTIREFISLVSVCDKFICGDSFSLHVSLALEKKTIGLFFCTPAWEVEGYGLLKSLVAPRLFEVFPERSDIYDEDLVKSISAEEVLRTLESFDE